VTAAAAIGQRRRLEQGAYGSKRRHRRLELEGGSMSRGGSSVSRGSGGASRRGSGWLVGELPLSLSSISICTRV
jgi:hypothetical protein